MIYPKLPDLVKPPPDDTPDTEKMNPQKPDSLNSNSDPTMTKCHRRVVGVEYAAVKPYG
jgi:hypothetical protein